LHEPAPTGVIVHISMQSEQNSRSLPKREVPMTPAKVKKAFTPSIHAPLLIVPVALAA
jgi:hypothetical protein